jgi:hypothetical protein
MKKAVEMIVNGEVAVRGCYMLTSPSVEALKQEISLVVFTP